MVENICSRCRKRSEYTIRINTNKRRKINLFGDEETYPHDNVYPQIVEHWCLPCLFREIPPMGIPPKSQTP